MLSGCDLMHTAKVHLAYLEMRQLVYIMSRFITHAVEAEKLRTGVNSSDVTVKF